LREIDDEERRKVDIGKINLVGSKSKEDFSYDLSYIINNALYDVMGREDAIRIIRFIESIEGRNLGELASEDVKRVIELFEIALGSSSHRVISDLIRALIDHSECRIDYRGEGDERKALEHVINDIIECLRGKSKRARELISNLLAEIRKNKNSGRKK